MSRYSVELAAPAELVAALHRRRARWLNAGASGTDAVISAQNLSAPEPNRHVHSERDFGIGYGNSSGYGTDRHYVRDWSPQRFSCR
jgi:hypothetical protein